MSSVEDIRRVNKQLLTDEGAADGNADFDDCDIDPVEATADTSGDLNVVAEDETRAPMQPQLDGNNRPYLITAADFPEEM